MRLPTRPQTVFCIAAELSAATARFGALRQDLAGCAKLGWMTRFGGWALRTRRRATRAAGQRGLAVLLACVLVSLAGAAAAHASDTPIGTGDLPSAVTDRDGTTHVVWLETNAGGTADTVTYCQIPRGSVTCAPVQHLVPTCAGGTPAPALHRFGGGLLDGDPPKVMVSPFGDVYVVTHGTCPMDWMTSVDPWHSEHGIDRQVVFHSTDGGATFAVEGGEARARGSRSSATFTDSGDTSTSSTLYDAADSRLVTAQSAYSGGYHCCDGVDTGVYAVSYTHLTLPTKRIV